MAEQNHTDIGIVAPDDIVERLRNIDMEPNSMLHRDVIDQAADHIVELRHRILRQAILIEQMAQHVHTPRPVQR